jgi:hypothetical protein
MGPEMRALVLVVSAEKKDVPSTEGMQTTVATSALFAELACAPCDVSAHQGAAGRPGALARNAAQFLRGLG